MKKSELVIDINAHIANITSKIEIDNDVAFAILSFNNLGYGIITAVKLKARGYNSFGDLIKVEGDNQFYLIIQDLKIENNESVNDIRVKLPNNEIRKLELEEDQVCYADGKVLSYAGEDNRQFETDEYETVGIEREQLEAIRDLVSKEAKLVPQNYDVGWLCSCGRYNTNETSTCSKCGVEKEKIFRITDSDFVSDLILRHRKNVQELQEKEKLEKDKREKELKKRNTYIGIGAIVGLILAIFIGHSIVMSGRTVYSSEDEMKTALQGIYTLYESGEAKRQIVIQGDSAIYKWLRLGDDHDIDSSIGSWNYKSGTFRTFEQVTVTSNGDLKTDDGVFERTGDLYSLESDNSSYDNDESAYGVLQIIPERLTRNTMFCVCTGTVKNNGTRTYRFIQVKGAFSDENGNVIDTDSTFACGKEGLEPGESGTFRLSVDLNYDIENCTVSLLDYEQD